MIEESLSPTFTSRSIDDVQKGMIQKVTLRFSQIEEILNSMPNSRIRSIALTELEKAALVVNKAISRMNDPA